MNTCRETARRRPLWPASIRLRLTLWNVVVLALMLAALGVALRYTLQVTLIASADRGLTHFARSIQSRLSSSGTGDLRSAFSGWPPIDKKRSSDPGPGGPFPPQILDAQGVPVVPDVSTSPYDRGAAQRALEGRQVFSDIRLGGQPFRLLSVPLRIDGRTGGVAQIPRPLGEINQEVRRLTNVLLLLAAPALLIAGFGAAFLTSRALRPIRQITQAAEHIEAENLSGRLAVQGRDELSELAATFNGMLDRLEEAFTRLERANSNLERANEQQRRFTADASHELKTPLTVIAGTVSLSLSGERTAVQYQHALETVGNSANIMTRIVQDLLLLARSDAGQLNLERRIVPIYDLLSLAREAVAGPDHAPIDITILDKKLSVPADPDHLIRLFVNLLDNATRHTPPTGRIDVSASFDDATIRITIADTGVGIAPEHLPHVFERFYRVDAARARRHGGTGLGLAICQSIVAAHDGTISIESAEGEGTTAIVRLPRASVEPVVSAPSPLGRLLAVG